MAPEDWAAAEALADAITDPWYACQAYAVSARFAPASQTARLTARSFARADAGADAYQRLAAQAWPLRALLELGRPDEASRAFDAAAGLAAAVTPAASRAEACMLVFQACVVGPPGLACRTLAWLSASLHPADHWRERRALREAALIAATIGLTPVAATPADDAGLLGQVAVRLVRGERREPRAFF